MFQKPGYTMRGRASVCRARKIGTAEHSAGRCRTGAAGRICKAHEADAKHIKQDLSAAIVDAHPLSLLKGVCAAFRLARRQSSAFSSKSFGARSSANMSGGDLAASLWKDQQYKSMVNSAGGVRSLSRTGLNRRLA
ncbi:hypothetical protein [Aminobacter sp. LjRoot7]|uniref:hypothetical protein n=1 Tax=Aminobacter sp. LjRoot7 TaxID=3342335 RepID=UPI003ECD75AE